MTINLAAWSLGRVLLVSLGWVVLLPVLVALYFFLTMVLPQMNTASGSAGIGAVSVGIPVVLIAVLWFLPPVALVVAWVVLRFR